MKNRKTLGVLSALALGISTLAYAVPDYEVEIFYYSDNTYSTEVGYANYQCSGEIYKYGVSTKHMRKIRLRECFPDYGHKDK